MRRRCALPGCDALVEETPDRPGKIYCTAAHRLAARRERRAAAQAAGDDRLTETLPWLREAPERPLVRTRAVPARVEALPDEEREPEPAELPGARSSWMAGLARRRRAIAVLGATAVLVGGYALTTSVPPLEPSPPTVTVPEGTTDEEWAERAQLALVAVNEQLDTVSETERTWNAVSAAQPAGTTTPVAVQHLLERRRVLEQQRTTLQSQLETYRELERTSDELRQADSRLGEIEKLLEDTPAPPSRSAADTSWATALSEQRDLRVRHRDAVASQVQNLSEGVRTATRSPLPNDADRTERVRDEVLRLARDPGPTPPSTGVDERPSVVQGRDEDESRPSGEVGTSGPPDPRGPGDDTEEQPRADRPGDTRAQGTGAGRQARAGEQQGPQRGGVTGAVSGAVDGVGGAVGLNGQENRGRQAGREQADRSQGTQQGAGRPASAGKGSGEQAGGQQGARRGGVTGAVSDTVDGVGGALGLDGGARADDGQQGPGQQGSGQQRAGRSSSGAPASGGARTGPDAAPEASGRAEANRGSGAGGSSGAAALTPATGAVGGAGTTPAGGPGDEAGTAGPATGRQSAGGNGAEPRARETGRATESGGIASAAAGPMIRTMTGGAAAPVVDEALRLADRRIQEEFARQAGPPGAGDSREAAPQASVPKQTPRTTESRTTESRTTESRTAESANSESADSEPRTTESRGSRTQGSGSSGSSASRDQASRTSTQGAVDGGPADSGGSAAEDSRGGSSTSRSTGSGSGSGGGSSSGDQGSDAREPDQRSSGGSDTGSDGGGSGTYSEKQVRDYAAAMAANLPG
ncbi:MAG: hypothetical protein OJJ54_22965 [Pseudonocardia sp.]|nr:hypothetical protein [Pseudonocardia sp.]